MEYQHFIKRFFKLYLRQFEEFEKMSALFSSASNPRSKNLIEFKAGKMLLQGKTVKPDKRKGLLYAYQSEDTLMHLCWKDRTSNVVEDVTHSKNFLLIEA
jgi:hypothetical protein